MACLENGSSFLQARPRASLVLGLVLGLTMTVATTLLHAQTFTLLHGFNSDDGDGYFPYTGLTIDAAGNLYGVTNQGGTGYGLAFRLAHRGGGWIYSPLYKFDGSAGADPIARLVIGRDGSLYGTATYGGSGQYGTVFNLRPPATFCAAVSCPWTATVLHNFSGYDGIYPTTIHFDAAGNIYGTTVEGGGGNSIGVVYKLTPSQGSWTYTMITNFSQGGGSFPGNGVTPDGNGNLYGTSIDTPGNVFEVTSSGQTVDIFNFQFSRTGYDPYSGLIMDSQGNLYGTTAFSGPGGDGGTVYELSPSGGGWSYNVLQGFAGGMNNSGTIGTADLLMDAQGNLYGTMTWNGANGYGEVYKLTPTESGWTKTVLHDFTGGDDGCYPWDGLVMDSQGNLYGTASACGPNGYYGGTVWEITP